MTTQFTAAEKRERWGELAVVFLKLGGIAFGGPAAHIAMMNEEVVTRRKWLTEERFLDLLGATNLIPGPNSTELAIHLGLERGGITGLIIAGSCFILPAFLLVWILGMLYVHFQQLPQLDWLLYGIKPVIMAVISQALWKLSKVALKTKVMIGVAGLGITLVLLGVNEILVLLLAGLGVMLTRLRGMSLSLVFPWIFNLPFLNGNPLLFIPSKDPIGLFWIFLKIGSVLYGSGYVLLAFLEKDLVDRLGWVTNQQLLDAVAIGQITPGPVFTTATFIGYLIAGHGGAFAATLGIFLPAFVFVALVNPWIPKLRHSRIMSGFLDGVNTASLALMAVVTVKLGFHALQDPLTIGIGLISAVLLIKYRINSAQLVLGGGILGFLAHQFVWIR